VHPAARMPPCRAQRASPGRAPRGRRTCGPWRPHGSARPREQGAPGAGGEWCGAGRARAASPLRPREASSAPMPVMDGGDFWRESLESLFSSGKGCGAVDGVPPRLAAGAGVAAARAPSAGAGHGFAQVPQRRLELCALGQAGAAVGPRTPLPLRRLCTIRVSHPGLPNAHTYTHTRRHAARFLHVLGSSMRPLQEGGRSRGLGASPVLRASHAQHSRAGPHACAAARAVGSGRRRPLGCGARPAAGAATRTRPQAVAAAVAARTHPRS
jgi:hypothetical protein